MRFLDVASRAFIIGFSAACFAQSPPEDEIVNDAQSKVTLAEEALLEGHAERALEILEPLRKEARLAVLEKDQRARALTALGLAYEAMEDPESALLALEEAMEAAGQPGAHLPSRVPLSLARAALKMKDARTAQKALEHLGGEDLSQPPAAFLLGLTCFLAGDSRRAEANFVKIVEGDSLGGPSPRGSSPAAPEAAQAAFYLGVLRFDRGERERALKTFELAEKLDPEDYYVQVYIARALLDLDRPMDAVKKLKSLEARFATPEVHSLEGRAHLRQGHMEEAASSYQKALEASPRYGEALFGLGTALRRLGKTDEAQSALKAFQAIRDEESSRQKRTDALSQAVQRNPLNAGAFEELALLSLDGGDLEAAERNAWLALRVEPLRVRARLALARALVATGRYRAAAIHYQRILRKDPEHQEARREMEDLVRRHARRRP